MTFEIDWKGVPPRLRLSAKLVRKLNRVFGKKVARSRKRFGNVAFVRSATMRSLNRIYRNKDQVTDILSFARGGKTPFPNEDPKSLGDIVLCLPYIRKSARQQKAPLTEELVRVMVHGAMHCLGYDHLKPREAVKMLPLQERIVRQVLENN